MSITNRTTETPGLIPGPPITMSYGELPTQEQFEYAFTTYVSDFRGFSFGNDKRVGTCKLSSSELWLELNRACTQFHDHLDSQIAQDAGDWCSCVLSCLGF